MIFGEPGSSLLAGIHRDIEPRNRARWTLDEISRPPQARAP
jgi:hypothetical protein